MASSDPQRRLIARLARGDVFDPPAAPVQVVETHISWILLAGTLAYKIKKPVNFGFVDFSTLERRHHFCDEELRLNRRLAPDLYLRVAAIGGTPDTPRFDAAGPPIEYALVMRRFDEAGRADRLLAAGVLAHAQLESFARELADFHARAGSVSPQAEPEQPARAQHWVTENLEQIAPFVAGTRYEPELAALRAWTGREYARLAPELQRRLAAGRVRDGHGDLHLANLVLWQGRLQAFDCLEFNAELRRIDVASEVAFLFMDLEAHERRDLAWRFLNVYLEAGGDYALCTLLRHFVVYRALVRVKVECLNAAARGRADVPETAGRYLALARRYGDAPPVAPLLLMHGLSGSGKSRVALELAGRLGAVRLRSDVERRRLMGGGRGPAAPEQGAYRPEITERVYALLRDTARPLLQAGLPVIVDATFLKRAQRTLFEDLARSLGVPFRILHCTAPDAVLRERVRTRERAGADPSEATLAVLDHQVRSAEPLSGTERAQSLVLDTSKPLDAALADVVRQLRG